ncbi:hypothetical protein HKCCE3408_18505 [Rhodobacterales bacterium HKCCE3408]|nr:hypothetical protein [Rhodobacterales bacterium HKCCE3408]
MRVLRVLVWIRAHVPPGVRFVLGLLLICGGLLAFLPVLGLWMLPAGIAVAAMDVRPLLRWWRGEQPRTSRTPRDPDHFS